MIRSRIKVCGSTSTTATTTTMTNFRPMSTLVKRQGRGISQQVTAPAGNRNINNQQKQPMLLIPCPTLTTALPRLRALFAKKSSNGVFPLFSPAVTKRIWENVDHAKNNNNNNNNNTSNEVGGGHRNRRRQEAAILVSLVSLQAGGDGGRVEDGPSLLFTVRASHLTTHAAEVSFPGGHFDNGGISGGSNNENNADSIGGGGRGRGGGDVTLEDTAIREAQEELLGHDYPWHAVKQQDDNDDHGGVVAPAANGVEILGRATALPSITGTSVTPIIAVLPYIISNDTFPGNEQEVDEVFYVSLKDLVNMETMEPSPRFQSDIPVYPVGPGKKIWGLTAVVTRPILHNLFKPIFLSSSSSPTDKQQKSI
jgi:hypothetical protein